MNIINLRNRVKNLEKIINAPTSKEFIFSGDVKKILYKTNFEIVGEELCLQKYNNFGKCDIWLANCPNNFLLSLELKVGERSNKKKQNFLIFQVNKYTDFMKFYYPEYRIFGLGAYKYECGINFYETKKSTKMISREINILKSEIINQHLQ